MDELMLGKIASALGISADAIIIFGENGTAFKATESYQRPAKTKDELNSDACESYSERNAINLIDKLVELVDENRKLYERLLASEREKAAILQQRKET